MGAATKRQGKDPSVSDIPIVSPLDASPNIAIQLSYVITFTGSADTLSVIILIKD